MTDPLGRFFRSRRLILICTAGAIIAAAGILADGVYRRVKHSNIENCANNLHQIGLAMFVYANQQKDFSLPDSLQRLVTANSLTPGGLVCPASNDTQLTAPTTREFVAAMSMPGHVSYIYLGKGLVSKNPLANQVLAYEPLANHGSGMNVLLGDGHVEFVDAQRAAKVIADVKATKKPVLLRQ